MNVENSGDDPRLPASAQEPGGENRSCSICKTPLSADNLGAFCPVCMLRSALTQTLELGEEKLIVAPELEVSENRFEHYELVRREDGAPLELGRGAMGITFKAIDTNLRRPVALKVVKARLLDNEVIRQRFISEARAAASLRHPNVASVFHLGSGFLSIVDLWNSSWLWKSWTRLLRRSARPTDKISSIVILNRAISW